jgi:hypothetical protein
MGPWRCQALLEQDPNTTRAVSQTLLAPKYGPHGHIVLVGVIQHFLLAPPMFMTVHVHHSHHEQVNAMFGEADPQADATAPRGQEPAEQVCNNNYYCQNIYCS